MKAAIVVAGGMGRRMNSLIPKQFLLLHGTPVVMYPLMAFFRYDRNMRIILALPGGLLGQWQDLQRLHRWNVPVEVVPGGDTRFHSVQNCLACLKEEGLVAIHDGARPLLTVPLIGRLFDAAGKNGNAVPVVPVNESVRITEGSSSRPADRSSLRIVQTPQVFDISRIRQAYGQPYRSEFTDDATVFESMGNSISLVEGDPVNIKITCNTDLAVAEALANSSGLSDQIFLPFQVTGRKKASGPENVT